MREARRTRRGFAARGVRPSMAAAVAAVGIVAAVAACATVGDPTDRADRAIDADGPADAAAAKGPGGVDRPHDAGGLARDARGVAALPLLRIEEIAGAEPPPMSSWCPCGPGGDAVRSPWGPTVFRRPAVRIDTLTAAALREHFGVSEELAGWILSVRRR